MRTVHTEGAPAPTGHYAQAVIEDRLVLVSGQLPIDAASGKHCTESVGKQVEQALKNLQEVLNAAGSDLNHVLRTTVYISDVKLWGEVDRAYARSFGTHRPARSIVPTGPLHYGFQVEIEAIAVLRGVQSLRAKPEEGGFQ